MFNDFILIFATNPNEMRNIATQLSNVTYLSDSSNSSSIKFNNAHSQIFHRRPMNILSNKPMSQINFKISIPFIGMIEKGRKEKCRKWKYRNLDVGYLRSGFAYFLEGFGPVHSPIQTNFSPSRSRHALSNQHHCNIGVHFHPSENPKNFKKNAKN